MKLRPSAKLTMEQAHEIHVRYAAGGITQLALAEEYDVSTRVIYLILHGATYKGSKKLA